MGYLSERWVLQLCHGYEGPFLDCARQYASLFKATDYRVLTVFLTGGADPLVAKGCEADEVIFLGHRSKDIGGLKLSAIRQIREIEASRSFSLCIAHRFKSIYIACLATSLPVIGVLHAFGVFSRITRRAFANAFAGRLILLGVSNAVRDEIRQQLPAWPDERIETLYNHIDVPALQAQQLSREAAREALGLPAHAWIIANVGRLHPDKDQATLIRGFAAAIAELPRQSLLVILGRGSLEPELKTSAAELGVADKVVFLGQIPMASHYFRAFDQFVLTSDREPFGMVLLEALAALLPVVCSDCGGGREVVDGVGQLFPFGDVERLKNCLVERKPASEEGLQRLNQMFSDPAASGLFWQLPAVRHLRLDTCNNSRRD